MGTRVRRGQGYSVSVKLVPSMNGRYAPLVEVCQGGLTPNKQRKSQPGAEQSLSSQSSGFPREQRRFWHCETHPTPCRANMPACGQIGVSVFVYGQS